MKRLNLGNNWTKIVFAALFFQVMIVGFFPAMIIGGEPIGPGELLRGQEGEILKELFPYLDGYPKALDGFVGTLRICSALSVLLPLMECGLVLLLQGGGVLLCAGLGVFANAAVKIILAMALETGRQNTAGDPGGAALQLEPVATGVWVVLHAAIAGLILWSLLRGYHRNTKRKTFRSREEIIDETVEKGRIRMGKDYHGGISGITGPYRGKACLLEPGEILSVGSSGDNEIIIPDLQGREYACRISYDEDLAEYHVKPSARKTVFLASGQPLGPNRVYCLPRETEIVFGEQGARFKLL